MARDRGPPVLRQPGALPSFPAQPRGWAWLAAGLWPALLVGLLAALLAWLWYGGSDGTGEEGGGEGSRLVGGEEEEVAEGFLESGGEALLEAKAAALSSPRQSGEDLAVPTEELNHVPSGKPLQVEQPLPKPGAAECGEHPSDPGDSRGGDQRAQAGRAGDGWCLMNLAGASDDECKDRNEEQPNQPAERRDLDREEWEVVSEPLSWGDAGKAGGAEDSASTEREQGDCPEGDSKSKRVVAVPPLCQTTRVTFRVHYLTHSASQLLGVTGDHERLGRWRRYVPLRHERDGFWARSVSLPADTTLSWKFILLEDGKVRRWEECGNRTLVTEHEEQVVHQWWGYH